MHAYVRAMRMIWTGLALVALSSPVAAQDCRFFNQTGQSIAYKPEDGRLTFFPAYDDSEVQCVVVGKTVGNEYALACDDGPGTLIPGMSTPDKPFIDVVVVNKIFFWLKCKETT